MQALKLNCADKCTVISVFISEFINLAYVALYAILQNLNLTTLPVTYFLNRKCICGTPQQCLICGRAWLHCLHIKNVFILCSQIGDFWRGIWFEICPSLVYGELSSQRGAVQQTKSLVTCSQFQCRNWTDSKRLVLWLRHSPPMSFVLCWQQEYIVHNINDDSSETNQEPTKTCHTFSFSYHDRLLSGTISQWLEWAVA